MKRASILGLSVLTVLAAACGFESSDDATENVDTAASAINNVAFTAKYASGMNDPSTDSSNHEHCALRSSDITGSVQTAAGRQVRITNKSSGRTGICTVVADDNVPAGQVWLGKEGLSNRLGVTDLTASTDVYIDGDIFNRDTKLVETVRDDGMNGTFVVTAPHGGYIEQYSNDEADAVYGAFASSTVSSWVVTGNAVDSAKRWHITSTEINTDSFTGLRPLVTRRFRYALSFHGMDDTSRILIGGRDSVGLRSALGDAINEATLNADLTQGIQKIDIAAPGALGGSSVLNFVNRLANNDLGVQIEQSMDVRSTYRTQVAGGVAAFYHCLLDGPQAQATYGQAQASIERTSLTYTSSACKLFTTDLAIGPDAAVLPAGYTNTNVVIDVTADLPATQADCAATTLYANVFQQQNGRFVHAGLIKKAGVWDTTSGTCSLQLVAQTGTLTNGPVTVAPPAASTTYRVVARARTGSTLATLSPLNVRVQAAHPAN